MLLPLLLLLLLPLTAESDGEKDEWIGAIGKAIVRYSESYKKAEESDDEESDDE